MAERVEFGLPVQALQGAPESGDRFVYSYRFATLNNLGSNGRPVLTLSQWVYLSKAADFDGDPYEAWQSWHSQGGDDHRDMSLEVHYGRAQVDQSRLAEPTVDDQATARYQTSEETGQLYTGQNYGQQIHTPTAQVQAYVGTTTGHGAPTTGYGSPAHGQGSPTHGQGTPSPTPGSHTPGAGSFSPPGPGSEAYDPMMKPTTREVLVELATSEIGVLFLDRTRLRPSGFVVGEHLHTIGLAAAEEVVLEQRSFVQRETTDEHSGEVEETAEGETTTSTSKDESEVITGTETTTRTDGFNAGGNIGFEYGVKVNLNGGMNDTTTEADNDSRTNSVKEIHANTTKNVAKLRSLHKTVFKISATDRFERSARRTIRNPNAHTPIDLHFYKVLQRIRFSQERYGVRLCWTPFVGDPAGTFFGVEASTKADMLRQARNSIPMPAYPDQPNVAEVPGTRTVGLDPPFTELTGWNNTVGSDMSADYTLPINFPTKMKWDGDTAFVHASLRSDLTGHPRQYSVDVVGDPWEVVNSNGDRTLFQKVHAGAEWCLYGSQIYVSLSARAIPDTTSLAQAQAAALADWESERKRIASDYNAKVAEAEATALVEFDAWRVQYRASLNPKQELMRCFITKMFPADDRDHVAELDVWEQVFDWSLMSARLYSGTWHGDGLLRDPKLPPTDFVNASWARLYLPVRPGFEEVALRWMHLRSKIKTGPVSIEDFIAKILKDLKDWRVQNLGGPAEVTVTPVQGQSCPNVVQKYVCLGTWLDDMPTDGVHTEVTLAKTTAADTLTEAIGKADKERAVATAAALVSQGKISDAVAAAKPKDVDVQIHFGEHAQ